MPKTELGRYCGSCKSNTIDFFKLSNKEINSLLLESHQQGKEICGRIFPYQLNSAWSEMSEFYDYLKDIDEKQE